ncbi:hypothetical protein M409DRAFT_30619 [Zasmidium cellare ATCC 36951]|uniref:Uncharacterized protein n=1 Tax=Zasmidium cellare ATCC 36951 TaxID=1080233 RepID=A0A6A6BVR2_ZASCE|nr:uncharacterized protein M409DRAFT_30619 [Zasmidium cellare ATCC 36951]KAF2158914.1 hypothetical protein M409DRAFT_30619 [Zasmidium cellare ATCC 36951]
MSLPPFTRSNKDIMDLRHAEANSDLSLAKVVYEDQILGFEDVFWNRLPQYTKKHILARPDLGSAQVLVLLVMSSSSLAASPSLFLEAFREPEGIRGFPDPRFVKAFGDPEAWERMCKAAKGELTFNAMKGTRYLTSKSMLDVVETLEVHGREVGANLTEKGYLKRSEVEVISKEVWGM